MSDSLTKWLDRVSVEDANEGVAKPVEDKNVKAPAEANEDAAPGASEASAEIEIKVVAKENEGGEADGGGPAAGPSEAAPLTTGSDGGANAGEEGGGAAPVAPVVPVDGEPGPANAAEGGMAASAEPVVEPGAEPAAAPAEAPVEPVEPAAAVEPVIPATEDGEPDGTAKPVEDKNVKANLESDGAGEAGSEATEEAAGNPDEIKVVAKEDEGGEAEAIGVPAEFEVPETESETAVANRHMNEVADDLGRIDQVNTALEAYHCLLTQSIEQHGVVTPALARAVQIGLEAFGEATLTDLMPSVEDFAVSTTRTEASERSVEGVSSKFKQMLEIARAAIKKLLEWLGNIWNGIMQDTGKMVTKLDSVKSLVDKIKTTNTKPMVVNGVDRLSINGFFVGDTAAPIRVVNDTVEYFTQDYPKVFNAVVTAIKVELTETYAGHEHASMKLQIAISDAVATKMKFPGLPSEKAKDSEIPSGLNSKVAVSRSKVFPGNMALFYALTTSSKDHFGADPHQLAAWKFSDIFQIQFARLADAKMMPAGGDGVKVPDARVLRQMCAEVAALISTLEDLKEADKYAKEFAKQVEDLSRKWFAMNMGMAWASFGQNMMNGLAKAYSTPSGNLFGYTASLVKAYLAIIERFAEHHGAAATGGNTVNGKATRVEE